MATEHIQDTARATYVAELEQAYAQIDSAQELAALAAATRPDYIQHAEVHHAILIRELRQLVQGLRHAATEHSFDNDTPAEKQFWAGYRMGLQLAASRLERVLNPKPAERPNP